MKDIKKWLGDKLKTDKTIGERFDVIIRWIPDYLDKIKGKTTGEKLEILWADLKWYFSWRKGLGADFDEPENITDIPVGEILTGKTRPPTKVEVEINDVRNQGKDGACTAYAGTTVLGSILGKNLSSRWTMAMAKYLDGLMSTRWRLIEGSWGRTVANSFKKYGAVLETTRPSPNNLGWRKFIGITFTKKEMAEAKKNRIKGYAFINLSSITEMRRVLDEFNVPFDLTVANMSWNSKTGELSYKRNYSGAHRISIYKIDGDKVWFENSWGKKWGVDKNGKKTKNNNGFGFFSHKEMKKYIRAGIVYTPFEIKKTIIKKYKSKQLRHPKFSSSEIVGLDNALLKLIYKARDIAKISFVFTSGYRSRAYNKKIGGAKNSCHIYRMAVDVRVKNSTERFKIVEAGIKAGFKRIGIAKNFVHLDACDKKTNHKTEIIWLY